MKLALVLRPIDEQHLLLARQIGVTDIVTVPPDTVPSTAWDYDAILRHKTRIENAGLTWSVVESVPITDRIKLDLPLLRAPSAQNRLLGALGLRKHGLWP